MPMRLRPWLRAAPGIDIMMVDPTVAFGRRTVKGIRADVLRSRCAAVRCFEARRSSNLLA